MFTIQERKQSGAGDYGKDSSYEKSWIVNGTAADDASDAATMIVWACGQGTSFGNIPQLIQIPGTILIGYLTRLRYDNVSGNLMTWRVDGTYTSPTEWRTTGDHAFSFNTAGGTKKIKHALSHVQTYIFDSDGTASTGTTEFDGCLNPDGQGNVEGVDVGLSGVRLPARSHAQSRPGDRVLHQPAEDAHRQRLRLLAQLHD